MAGDAFLTPSAVPDPIPRWRGFNLPDLLEHVRRGRFREAEFELTARWGFNFIRLPLSYWNWSDPADWLTIREKELQPVDDALAFGRRYKVHVSVAFHRLPGYCINQPEREPFLLFGPDADGSARALDAAAHHWRTFAARYRGIPNSELSFDLINEPPWTADAAPYERIVRRLVAAIREADPDRLIFADGVDLGQTPLPELADLKIAQSTRGYLPKAVSHYQATWVAPGEFESLAPPAWPFVDRCGTVWDRERLRRELIHKWRPISRRGIPIHVGEWGVYSRTPHRVAMAWMRDVLSLWKEVGWGWALWNLRGSFGVLDSRRKDVRYEWCGRHRLDREMLELLQAG